MLGLGLALTNFGSRGGVADIADGVSSAALLLATYGPYGVALDFTDASIAINDVSGSLDYSSKGDVTGGALVGPAAKLTYAAPSPKMLEQSDGYQRYGAHNLYLNNTVPANQSITVVSDASYKIRVTGTVSIALTGATTGTVTAGSPVSFTAATATLTCGSTSGAGNVYVYRTPCNEDDVDTAGTALYALPYRWSSGVRQGLVDEPQSTNINWPSSTFGAGYVGSNMYVAAASFLLSTGITGGGSITETDVTSTHFVYPVSLAGGLSAATDYVYTVTVKGNTARYLLINHQGTANNFASAVFDTQDVNAVAATQTGVGSASGTVWSTRQERHANGCVTCTLVARCTSGATPTIALVPAATGNTFTALGLVSYAGSSARSMYIEHVQVEAGLSATSRIYTYGSAAVRAADNVNAATSIAPSISTAGTLYVSGITASGTGTQVLAQIDDGTANNRYRLVRDSSNNIRFIVTTAGVEVCNVITGTVADSTAFKVAAAWAANDFAAVLNGGTVQTDASGTLPTVATMRWGSSSAGEQFNGVLKQQAVIAARNANATLQAMTA